MATRPRSSTPPSPNRGAELLKKWREAQKKSQTEIAEKLAIAPETYNRFERGYRLPSRPRAAEIQALTDGAVPVSSWDDAPRCKVAS